MIYSFFFIYFIFAASTRVRKCLFDSLLDYVNRNKKDDAISNNDAVKVLTSLSGLRHYNKFLVSTSINSIQSNLGIWIFYNFLSESLPKCFL